jgi:hypothetical protein
MNFVICAEDAVRREAPAASSQPADSQSCALLALGGSPTTFRRPSPPPRPAAAPGPANRRIAQRRRVRLHGQIYLGSSQWLACTVHDMSATGALLELIEEEHRHYARDPLPDRFYLVIETQLERSEVECWVKWRKDCRAGVKFMGPIAATVKKLPPLPVRKASTIKRR